MPPNSCNSYGQTVSGYCLEVGGSGALTSEGIQASLRFLPAAVETAGREFDVSRRSTQQTLLEHARAGFLCYVHITTPRAYSSEARSGEYESARASFVCFAVALCRAMSRRRGHWSISAPRRAELWADKPVVEMLGLPGLGPSTWASLACPSDRRESSQIWPRLTCWPARLARAATASFCSRHDVSHSVGSRHSRTVSLSKMEGAARAP